MKTPYDWVKPITSLWVAEIGGHTVYSYLCIGPACKTRTQGADRPCHAASLYVNVVHLEDRIVRVYTGSSWLNILVEKEKILKAAIEEAILFSSTVSGNDICTQSKLGHKMAINFVGSIV
ncbi:MAG: hypothetical protein RR280_01255 [Bacteroidaceae bacterium]